MQRKVISFHSSGVVQNPEEFIHPIINEKAMLGSRVLVWIDRKGHFANLKKLNDGMEY